MPSPTRVLITGCSSGIGVRLMNLFDRDGYEIIATARASSFQLLKDSRVKRTNRILPRELDLTDLQSASELVSRIERDRGPIDILINNAGVSYRAVVEDMTADDEQLQMSTNYFGPMHLIRAVLPSMRKRKEGHIINISSVGGMMAMPTMSAYSASKFALEGATEALWYEVRPFNIKVTLVRPGFINSNSFRKVLYGRSYNPEDAHNVYVQHYDQMSGFIEKLMTRTPCTPESAAKMIFKISRMKNPPLRVAGTPDARFFAYLRRLLPRRLYHWLLYRSLPGVNTWGKQEENE